MKTIICKKFRIEGRVQGVFYRANTQRKARELGLTGFARNEHDGTVTVQACGDAQTISILQEWLWDGPPSAEVTAVTEQPPEPETFQDFITL